MPDPERMVQAYYQAVSTLNLLRAFTKGGFADLTQVHTWNQEFVSSSLEGRRYEVIANEIGRALRFMQAIGIDLGDEARSTRSTCGRVTRRSCSTTRSRSSAATRRPGDWYACSAHFLWVGERTRQPDGAHVEFLAGVENPVGAKIGPDATPDEVVAARAAQPGERIAGRSTFVSRLGADRVREALPPLVRAVRGGGVPVLWACDPMHANTFVTPPVTRPRRFDDVLGEIEGFFAAHREVGSWPGGVTSRSRART